MIRLRTDKGQTGVGRLSSSSSVVCVRLMNEPSAGGLRAPGTTQPRRVLPRGTPPSSSPQAAGPESFSPDLNQNERGPIRDNGVLTGTTEMQKHLKTGGSLYDVNKVMVSLSTSNHPLNGLFKVFLVDGV